MYIVLAILIFCLLIIVHELGHFIAAKSLGVKVNEFSIFMGPAILQKQKGETIYSLRCIPIGGFCAMEGEDEASENPRAFTSAKRWKRLVILAAGPLMNFLAGFIIISLVFSGAEAFGTPTIDSVYPGSSMEEAGVLPGDTIYSVDGQRVYLDSDISLLLGRLRSDRTDLVVKRDGQKVSLPDVLVEKREFEVDGETQLLYGIILHREPATFGTLMRNSWYNCIFFTRMVWMGLGDLITGRARLDEASGPVGMIHYMSETGKSASTTAEGIQNVFYFASIIAVNLAVVNLLPIPALDGGRIFLLIVTVLLETILRRKINPKYEGYIHAAGMILLFGLLAFITFHDTWMLFNK